MKNEKRNLCLFRHTPVLGCSTYCRGIIVNDSVLFVIAKLLIVLCRMQMYPSQKHFYEPAVNGLEKFLDELVGK